MTFINLYLYFPQKSIEIVAYSAFVDPWDRIIVLLRLWGKAGALLREESDKEFFFFCSSLQEKENEGSVWISLILLKIENTVAK